MNKAINLLAILILFICCNKKTDSFSEVKFGSVSRDSFLKQMLNNETFFVYHDNPSNIKDTTDIGYVMENNGNKYPMTVYFNEESIDKKYHTGTLRRLGFHIGEDKNEYGSTQRTSGKISKEFVDNLFESYLNIYGKPDSLIIKNKYKFKNAEEIWNGKKPSVVDNMMYPSKRAVWIRNNFKLVFYIPSVEKPTSKNKKSYFEYGPDIKIVFEMIGYDKEIKRVRDSIARILKPEDLVHIETGTCQWTNNTNDNNDKRLSIRLSKISRIEYLDEERSIKGVRFDLVITDSFKKELFKVEDLTIELPKQSYLESRPKKGAAGITQSVNLKQEFFTDFNSLNNPKLVFLKEYSERNEVNIEVVIKTILFEDGNILNSK